MRRLFLFLACFLLIGTLPVIFGQATNGTLVGTVVDATGATVPNATITAQNIATGVPSETRSNANGEYRFNNLPVGSYKVTANASGFTAASLNNVPVELNKTATANLTLQVGTVTTTVDVAESASVIDTTTSQVQSNYDSNQAVNLPMTSVGAAGTNLGVLNLSLLSAGVASAGGVGVGVGPAIGGQRPRNNSFNIEGVDNNRKDVSGPNVYLSNEATESFTLLQNQFNPEFGHSSGGQFNIVAKSGTNDIHGSIYEYLLNRNLNAVDQTLANQDVRTNPRFDQSRLGASIGGPIIKNKWFYFGNFEYQPLGRASTPATPVSAPTAQGYSLLSGIPNLSQTNLGVLKQYLGSAAVANDTTIVSGVKIPIGIIPVVAPNFTNQYEYVISSDYNISDRDQLHGRYIYNKISAIDNAAQLPAFYIARPTLSYLATLIEYHNFTPNVTNEFRLGFNRYNDHIPVPDFKFPGLDAFPNIGINDDLQADIGPDGNAPQFTVLNTYQLVDNVNWTRGAHTFKFGFDGRKLIAPQQFTQRARGDYQYKNLERYLLDLSPDVLGERSLGNATYYGDQVATYYYVNDNWRIRRNLSVNLGLRYEYTTIPFGERSQKLNSIASLPGFLEFREPKPQTKNFAPRVGFAYSPGNSGNTSIRAGFGMAYDVLFDNIGTLSLPPQFSTTHDVDLTAATPNFLKNGGIPANFQESTTLTQADARDLTSNYIPDQKLPYSVQWNLNVQHVFHRDYTVEARYLGSRGIHLITQNRINQVALVSPTRNLPTYLQRPSSSDLAGLPLTLGDLKKQSNNFLSPYGFSNAIVSHLSRGNSSYHGLALQVTRRFSQGLQFVGAYTWSHLIDDSTAEFFSTQLSPRRPQDFQNWRGERADSALDRRHRFTLSTIWDAPWFKRSNWFAKNIVGNWLFTGTYTAESPEYAVVQSGVDSNLNGDSAGDRTVLNVNGVKNTGSSVIPVNRAGQTVKSGDASTAAYIAVNPSAQYIVAGPGAFATAPRNTFPTRGINNFDLSLVKRFNFTERKAFEIGAQAFNAFNHAQFIPGSINTVYPQDTHLNGRSYLIPGNRIFGDFTQAFSSNPRNVQIVARFTF